MEFSNDKTNFSTPEDYSTSKPWTLTNGDGKKTVSVRFQDKAGNYSDIATETIILDTTPPIVEILSPANNAIFIYTPITVIGRVEDRIDTHPAVTVNGQSVPVVSGGFSIDSIGLNLGNNTITATATDLAKNTSADTITVIFDNTPPATPEIITDKYSNSLTKLSASWHSQDPESGIRGYQYAIGTTEDRTDVVDWISTANTEATCSNLNLIEGQRYYFIVKAINGAGLESISSSQPITATEPISISITSPQNNSLITENEYPLTGTATGVTEIGIDNGKETKTIPVINNTFTATLIAPGTAARKEARGEDLSNYIIMNFPGPTTITAQAGEQTHSITVYCYQLFVKREFLTKSFRERFYGYAYTIKTETHQQTWNYNLLAEPPFLDWQEPNCSTRWQGVRYYYGNTGYDPDASYYNGQWWYYNGRIPWGEYLNRTTLLSPLDSSRDIFRYRKIILEIESGDPNYLELEETTHLTIHTLPAINGQVQPMVLIFCGARFYDCCSRGGTYDLSQIKINGKPLKPIFSIFYNHIILTNYEPDTDMELEVTIPEFISTCECFCEWFSFDNVNLLRVELSSDKADSSPQQFIFGETDIGDPCTDKEAPALTIFYKDVIDEEFNILPFSIDLTLYPTDTKEVQWTKHKGPDSGILTNADQAAATFSNPTKGGLYQFVVDVGGKTTKTSLLLPLAGADMTDWLDDYVKTVKQWALYQKKATEEANDSPILWRTKNRIFNVWLSIAGRYFDHVFDPVDSEEKSPCRAYQLPIGPRTVDARYGYLTVNGVVVHGSKINNMLYGLFGSYWGYSESELKLGAHGNQFIRSLRESMKNLLKGKVDISIKFDNESSQNAISLGVELKNLLDSNPNASITTVLTKPALRSIQVKESLDEEKLWPSPYEADLYKSTFISPDLPIQLDPDRLIPKPY